MWFHLYKYRLRCLIKNKALLFWTFIFPILLGGMFMLAFKDIDKNSPITDIPVGIVTPENKNSELTSFTKILSQVEINQNKKLFKVKKYPTQEKLQKDFIENKVAGYYSLDKKDELQLTINEQDTPQLILKDFLNQYEQMKEMMREVKTTNFIFSNEAFVDTKIGKTKLSTGDFYFFTLIGMTILYGFMFGVLNANDQQANQSMKGVRLTLIPKNKLIVSSANLLSSFSVFYIGLLCVIAIFYFLYQVNFTGYWGPLFLISALGSLNSITLGTLIGTILYKWNYNQKLGLGISITMTMSLFAGMMGTEQIKYWIDLNLPILGKINLVNLVSDSMLQLFLSNNYHGLARNLLWLSGLFLSCLALNIMLERRVQYDSL